MDIDVIVSAHANARALHFTLLGLRLQHQAPHTVWVAEDGEDAQVAKVVQAHAAQAPFAVEHLRQPHRGFRKWTLVNRAIRAARSSWLVFTDADCVPRADLLQQYTRLAQPGHFVAAGSHLQLPRSFHEQALTDAWLQEQQLFDARALRRCGVRLPASRLRPAGFGARLLDLLTPRDAFVGNNAGAWREDLLRVAGFDESLGYGGADRNLGLRLNHVGVRGLRARHSLVCLHLEHERPWRDPAAVAANKAWNQRVQLERLVLPRQSLLLPPAPSRGLPHGAALPVSA